MTDEQKAELEHLAKLADDRWREFDHKSQAEWKLCYALWAALLAAASVLLSNMEKIKGSPWILFSAVTVFGVLLLVLHMGINVWLHERMGELRGQLNIIFKKRASLLGLPIEVNETKSTDTMAFQSLVTIALVVLLSAVAASRFAS